METAQKYEARQEFWTPAADHPIPPMIRESCTICGAELVVGSRYCHVCGARRDSDSAEPKRSWLEALDFNRWREVLGLGTASLVAFIFGIGCLLAALFTGVVYSATTLLDWQAIQLWRIEWLLAAMAALTAGVLLKKS